MYTGDGGDDDIDDDGFWFGLVGWYCNILQSCLSEDKDWGFDLAGEGSWRDRVCSRDVPLESKWPIVFQTKYARHSFSMLRFNVISGDLKVCGQISAT